MDLFAWHRPFTFQLKLGVSFGTEYGRQNLGHKMSLRFRFMIHKSAVNLRLSRLKMRNSRCQGKNDYVLSLMYDGSRFGRKSDVMFKAKIYQSCLLPLSLLQAVAFGICTVLKRNRHGWYLNTKDENPKPIQTLKRPPFQEGPNMLLQQLAKEVLHIPRTLRPGGCYIIWVVLNSFTDVPGRKYTCHSRYSHSFDGTPTPGGKPHSVS